MDSMSPPRRRGSIKVEETILYIEGNAGAGGDMIVSALLDLGFPVPQLKKTLHSLSPTLGIQEARVNRAGIRARAITPILPKSRLKNFRGLLDPIEKSALPKSVRRKAAAMIQELGNAEAKVHGKPLSRLEFEELGGWDTLLDFAGAAAGFDYFHPSKIFVGPLNSGRGWIKSRHGKLPVPAPAVAELMKKFFLYSAGAEQELLTPTGAAILKTVGIPVPEMPKMKLEKTGYGAGKHDFSFPNVVRIFLGKTSEHSGENLVLKMESNIDDMNPQFWEHIFEKLYRYGALEIFLTPVIAKKSRPAHLLTVLAPLHQEKELEEVIFRETTTLGIRKEVVPRAVLERAIVYFPTRYGNIPCKVAYRNGKTLNIQPEYQFIKNLAEKEKISVKQLHHALLNEIPCPAMDLCL